MFHYEMLLLASPEITKDEESTLEKQIDKLINDAKGTVTSFDRWGKYRLAYPVRKNDYGVYFLMRFDVEDNNVLKDIHHMFYIKFNSIVMRSMFTKLDKEQSLEYKKPLSLEDTPKKPIGFLQETELKPRSARYNRREEPKRQEAVVEVVKEEIEVTEEKEAPEAELKSKEAVEVTEEKETVQMSGAQESTPEAVEEAPEKVDDSEKQEV